MHASRILVAVLALALVAPTGLGDWSQYRHDDERSGHAEEPGEIEAAFEVWAFDADGPIVSSPALTSVDGESTIVFGSYPGQNQPGSLYALNADGTERWSTGLIASAGFVASPTVEDLDGDEDKDVVLPSFDDSRLRVFDARTGEEAWSTQVGSSGEDLLASSPLVADVHDDPGKEIVLGGSLSDHDGSLLVYDDDGDRLQAIELDGPAWSSPLLADLDGDGDDELAIATGVPSQLQDLFPNAKTGGRSLYAFERGSGGWAIDWQVTLTGPSLATPTAHDLDDDGTLELALGADGGHFYAIEGPDGTVDANHSASTGPLVALSSPAIADLDDDGTPEVAVGVHDGVQALELTADGYRADGRITLPQAGPDEDQDPWVGAGIAIADLDGQAGLDIVAMTVPVNVTDELLNSDALPGTVFAVDGSDLAKADTQPLFAHPLPDDGGLSGPVVADVDEDGRSEILAGEGVPLVGNGSTMHLLDAANPIVEQLTASPADPTTQDAITLSADTTDENDPDDELTHSWDLGDGNTTTEPTPTHSYADDGSYNVTVSVEDPDGYETTETLTLAVANVAPSLTASADTTPDSLEVRFDGQAEDPDGRVGSVRWNLGDGNTTTETSPTHTYDTGGTYEASFKATDDDGDTRTEPVTVHVNRFPTLDGDATANASEGQALVLALPYDDPDGDAVHVAAIEGAPGASATVTDDHIELVWAPPYDIATRSNTPVPVDVAVTIEDEGTPAGTATHHVTVDVENTNRAPTIEGPSTVTASTGHTSAIEGTLGDPDGNPVTTSLSALPSYASFTREDDTWRLELSPPAHADPATHNVTFTVDDGLANTTRTLTLEVLPNQPPVVDVLGPTMVDAHTVANPSSATFEGTADDPDGDPVPRWRWRTGETTDQGRVLDHRFFEHGTYELELTAWDANGAAGQTTHTVHVDDALAGDAVVQPSQAGPTVDRFVTVQASYDDGTPLAGAEIGLRLHHESFEDPTRTQTVTTDADGRAQARIDGELGLGFLLPGEHTVVVSTEAPSLADAAVQDQESLSLSDTFTVTT